MVSGKYTSRKKTQSNVEVVDLLSSSGSQSSDNDKSSTDDIGEVTQHTEKKPSKPITNKKYNNIKALELSDSESDSTSELEMDNSFNKSKKGSKDIISLMSKNNSRTSKKKDESDNSSISFESSSDSDTDDNDNDDSSDSKSVNFSKKKVNQNKQTPILKPSLKIKKSNSKPKILSFESLDSEDSFNDDSSIIEVPNSSPQRQISKHSSTLDSSPVAVTTRLPNLREKFAFREDDNLPNKAAPFSNFKNDYMKLRSAFPDASASIIQSTLRKQKSLKEAANYLEKIYKLPAKKSINSRLPTSSSLSRLDSLSKRSISRSSDKLDLEKAKAKRLERQRIIFAKEAQKRQEERVKKIEKENALRRKKAENENIISSKVQIDSVKNTLRSRYINDKFKRKQDIDDMEEEEEEEEEDDDNEDDDSDVVELVGMSDSEEENISSKTNRKRKYEQDDDDYAPASRNKPRRRLTKRLSSTELNKVDGLDDEFAMPEYQEDNSGLNINEKVIKLYNNADIRDIIDLSGMTPEQAAFIIENRPYKSVKDILKLALPSKTSKSRKSMKEPIERFTDTITLKLQAYSAIDTLLKQCFECGKSITKELKKWGVNLKGKQFNGELAISEVDINESNEIDESSDEDEDIVETTNDKIKNKRKKFRIDGSENDDDYTGSSNRKICKSSIDNSIVKDKLGYFKYKPSLMADDVVLKDYQQVGINWLHLLFQKQLSCILADEMGLGKTIQVIAFLAFLKKKKYKGPHLIVVPSSTLENWLREFEKFAPSFTVVPYYGSPDEREELRYDLANEDYDVVITTYNLTMGKIDAPFLQSLNFNVIVYDEGHMLKNAYCDRYKKLTKLKANFRLILTGTPLQNNLKELVSLLDFILPEIFNSKIEKLELLFSQRATTKDSEKKIEGETYNPLMSEQAIAKAKVMMSPFVLRRTKAQVMKDLPTKHTAIEYCNLNPSQRHIYDEELKLLDDYRTERDRRKLLTDAEQKILPKLSNRNTNILMILRKACMHPLLFRRYYTDKMLKVMTKRLMKNENYINANPDYIFEDFQYMTDFELTQFCHEFPNELGNFVLKQKVYEDSGKVKILVELLTKKIKNGEKILVFSLFTQMLDILEKVLSLHNWKFLRLDGSTAVDTRQSIIDKFYEDKSIPIMLLSTKAGGFGINLVCASNVIIYDQSLNPHDDKQAEDRAHRVGQTKEVYVTRLITKDSIEENILHMSFNKLQLDNSLMAQNVEDILLKTVEDIISKKNINKPEKDSKLITDNDIKESDEGVFEAFEAPMSIEMAADEEEKVDEPIIIEKEVASDGKRTKRRRPKVDYIDDLNIPELDDDTTNKPERAKKNDYNQEERKDKSFVLNAESISDEDVIEHKGLILTIPDSLKPDEAVIKDIEAKQKDKKKVKPGPKPKKEVNEEQKNQTESIIEGTNKVNNIEKTQPEPSTNNEVTVTMVGKLQNHYRALQNSQNNNLTPFNSANSADFQKGIIMKQNINALITVRNNMFHSLNKAVAFLKTLDKEHCTNNSIQLGMKVKGYYILSIRKLENDILRINHELLRLCGYIPTTCFFIETDAAVKPEAITENTGSTLRNEPQIPKIEGANTIQEQHNRKENIETMKEGTSNYASSDSIPLIDVQSRDQIVGLQETSNTIEDQTNRITNNNDKPISGTEFNASRSITLSDIINQRGTDKTDIK